MAPRKTQRALDLATEKGSSAWVTVLPLQDLGFNQNKREFRHAVKLRHDWPVEDINMCLWGSLYGMICKLGGFITQRHNELKRSRSSRTRRVPCDIKNVDIDAEVVEGAIKSDY